MMVSSAQGGAPANPSSSRPRLYTKTFGKTFGTSYAPSTLSGADGGKCGGALPIVFPR